MTQPSSEMRGLLGERLMLEHLLSTYLDPPPGEGFFDVTGPDPTTTPAGTTVLVTPTPILATTIARSTGLFLKGVATSPTGISVGYRVRANGQELLNAAVQLTEGGLFLIYPLRLVYHAGPVRLEVDGISQTGANVTGVFARVVGYHLSGEYLTRHRMLRG